MKKALLLVTLVWYSSGLFSQNEKLEFYSTPNESRGYLSWPSYENSTYVIEYAHKIIDGDNVTYRTIDKQQLKLNYTKINSRYTTQPDIFYKVTVHGSAGQVTIDSDWILACLECGPQFYPVCHWQCNGTTYAWRLTLFEHENYGSGNLRLSTGFNYFDNNLGVAVPFYEAMTSTVYNARLNSGYYSDFYNTNSLTGVYPGVNYYKRTNVTSNEQIRDAQNNVLTGTVHFIGKPLMQFQSLSSLMTNNLAISQSQCGNTRGWAINTYNNNPSQNLPIDLECTSAYSTPGGGSSGSTDDDITNGANVEFIFYLIECMGDTYWANEFNLGDVLAGLPCEPGASGGGWTPLDAVSAEILDVEIKRIDQSTEGVILSAESLFASNSMFVSNNISFESGLYQVRFNFADGTTLPIVVENMDNSVQVNNASFSTLQIAPNPIEDRWLKINMSVERRMQFDLEIVSLQGEVLHKEKRHMHENTTAERSIKLNQNRFPYNQLIVRMVFEDGSVNQSMASIPE